MVVDREVVLVHVQCNAMSGVAEHLAERHLVLGLGARSLATEVRSHNIVGKWVDWVLGHHGHHRSEVAIGEAQVKLADVRPREIL